MCKGDKHNRFGISLVTTDAHHPIWQNATWQNPEWRVVPDLPAGRDRGYKMAFIVVVNSMLWAAMLTSAWVWLHG